MTSRIPGELQSLPISCAIAIPFLKFCWCMVSVADASPRYNMRHWPARMSIDWKPIMTAKSTKLEILNNNHRQSWGQSTERQGAAPGESTRPAATPCRSHAERSHRQDMNVRLKSSVFNCRSVNRRATDGLLISSGSCHLSGCQTLYPHHCGLLRFF